MLHRLVGHVPTLAHRQALEVCAHVEVTTEELLRSALGDGAADLFEWLRGLPFIESGRYGVYPHDVVRDVLTQDLRWRDPEGYGSLHRNIHDHLLGRVRAAAGPDVIETTRSLALPISPRQLARQLPHMDRPWRGLRGPTTCPRTGRLCCG